MVTGTLPSHQQMIYAGTSLDLRVDGQDRGIVGSVQAQGVGDANGTLNVYVTDDLASPGSPTAVTVKARGVAASAVAGGGKRYVRLSAVTQDMFVTLTTTAGLARA